ncbi:MAG TPA: putative metal-dependent hydrolase [Bacteroidia bacterium]|nr:putative metal-dependent hydrolase [Bacteroidia bacterium]HNS12026.1 putative metal-dependent hydrolase [Bacteroidia bacterium]
MKEVPEIEVLKYPIGRFKTPSDFSGANLKMWTQTLESFPELLKKEVENLSQTQLDTPYREGGWTIRQVVHHLGDSHLNCYCRFKLAMTEDKPEIRPYFEDRWTDLEDAKSADVTEACMFLELLHLRLVRFLKTLSAVDWDRKFYHPEYKKEFDLKTTLASYAWHSEHHLHHIIRLKERNNWI